jgi:hypothetical protein
VLHRAKDVVTPIALAGRFVVVCVLNTLVYLEEKKG